MASQPYDDNIYHEDFKRDCEKYGYELIPTIIKPVKRVVAIGDMHGDLELFIETLKLAKVIDEKHQWKKGVNDTIVVVLGDILDSYRPLIGMKDYDNKNEKNSDIELDNYINNLKIQAIAQGSDVIALIGNHEIRNIMGIMDYVSKKSIEDQFGTIHNRIDQYKPGNSMAIKMGCTRTGIVVIGSNIFVHGGIVLSLLQKFGISGNTNKKEVLEKINLLLRKWLLGKIELQFDAINNIEKFIQLKTDNESEKTLLKKLGLDQLTPKDLLRLLNDTKISPFWYRQYGMLPVSHIETEKTKSGCKQLTDTLEILELDHMIIAHTPQNFVHHTGMNRFVCSGKRKLVTKVSQLTQNTTQDKLYDVWRLDIGNAHAFEPYNYTKICLNGKCVNVNQSTVTSQIKNLSKSNGKITAHKIIQVLEIIEDKTFNVLTKEIEVIV
jgi:hypothetical protein